MNKCAFKAQKLRARNKRENKTERGRAREEKEETCAHYLRSLTPEIPEGVKKQQRNSSAAAPDTDRSKAAITSPYTFGDRCGALET